MAKARAAKGNDTGKPYEGSDKRPSSTMKKTTPMKAIRAQCYDCVGGSSSEIAKCPAKECALFPYRFGKRIRNEEEAPGGD